MLLSTRTPKYTCGVAEYPWHDLDGFVMNKRGNPQTLLHDNLYRETYHICLKNLANNKASRSNKIPNTILKNMLDNFHTLFFLFFTYCYKQQQIQASWKISLTTLLYKQIKYKTGYIQSKLPSP